MERIENGSPNNNANVEDEKNQRDFRRTFGQKVAEVFNKEDVSADAQNEYLKRVQEERALLETLDSEQRQFQDYIFYKAIEDNPKSSQFIRNIPGLDTHKPLTEQLLKKNEDGSRKIPDETVGNILEFYQSVLKEKETEFAGEFEELLSNYESGLKDKVAKGKLPQALYENYKKAKDSGSMISEVRLFDLRPRVEDEEAKFEPPSAAAYIEHRGINNKGEIVDPEDTSKTMYRRFFLSPQQENALGSMKNMVNHELTHIIAGTKASFELLPSESGSADIPSWQMDTEGEITMAYREGMTEAIGQMIADSSPEADNYSLRHYLRSETGTYPGDREFLAKLIDIDERYRNENQDLEERESLENLFLEAYAENDGNKHTNALRNRLYFIFDNWKKVIKDEDFPDSVLDFLRKDDSDWQNVFSICLGELKLKHAYEGR